MIFNGVRDTGYGVRYPLPVSRSPNKGFTLLEVLLTIVLLAVAVASIMWALSTSLFASSDTEAIEKALNIAQAQMEEIKNTPFADLADSGPAADPVFPQYSVTVNVAEGQDPMQVDATVSWATKGGQTSVSLTTLAANY